MYFDYDNKSWWAYIRFLYQILYHILHIYALRKRTLIIHLLGNSCGDNRVITGNRASCYIHSWWKVSWARAKTAVVESMSAYSKIIGPILPGKVATSQWSRLFRNKANLRDLKAATSLESGNAQFESKSVMFCPVWPWNLMDYLGKQ